MHKAERRLLVGIDDFIAWEDRQAEKHELVGGEIYAMVGGVIGHGVVTRNVLVALSARLKRPCQALSFDVKVRVDAANSVYYPDVVVSCAEQDMRATVLRDPVLVVEVLSPGTAAFDRKTKRAHYALIPSVQLILLVDAEERRVELDRRDGEGWLRETVTESGALDLGEVGCSLDLDDIYAA